MTTPEQVRVVARSQAGDGRQVDRVARTGRERPTHVEHEPRVAGLELDARATDLLGASVHPDLHLICHAAEGCTRH